MCNAEVEQGSYLPKTLTPHHLGIAGPSHCKCISTEGRSCCTSGMDSTLPMWLVGAVIEKASHLHSQGFYSQLKEIFFVGVVPHPVASCFHKLHFTQIIVLQYSHSRYYSAVTTISLLNMYSGLLASRFRVSHLFQFCDCDTQAPECHSRGHQHQPAIAATSL